MTDRPGPWWRQRRGRFTAHWPTRLPGVRFLARGTLTHLVSPGPAGTYHAVAARAAARLALDELGRGISGKHQPEDLECAQHMLTLAVSPWHTPDGWPDLWFKARLTLLLPQQDADRAQRHQDALRNVELRLAQDRLQRQQLARIVTDRDSARVWWLERHLDNLTSLDWGAFQAVFRPLTGTAVTEDTEAERFARTFLYVWEQLDAAPGRKARFVATARTLFDQMDWADEFPWPSPPDDLKPATPSPATTRLTWEDEQ
ncbi:hypothetical protein [Streptomyces sp. NPDC085479]|uniref:hypothetical protein n=1 Tax=Streptomyces sp. NPDC085479 TaxID=3365726 RepID=UPI0037D76133